MVGSTLMLKDHRCFDTVPISLPTVLPLSGTSMCRPAPMPGAIRSKTAGKLLATL
ncbi:MAG: hypothetical protein AB8B86_01470 [Pseudomonadales bacterium]